MTNRQANEWTVSLLDLKTTDRVLEVGFGPGLAIQHVATLVPDGVVAGVDASETMLEIAQKRNAAGIAAGRVALKLGEMAALPYGDNWFDKVFAVQVINYLPDPLRGLKESYRVTKAGGRVALFLEPKEKFEKVEGLIEGIYTPYTAEEVAGLLRQAGFVRAWFETKNLSYGSACAKGICTLGEK
jgi:ubiquinone/menaquinone biosynthesis C-methylase UbiE